MALIIRTVSAQELPQYLASLTEILQDAVDNGASVGFLPPLDMEEAQNYWQKVATALPDGHLILLVAEQEGTLVGTVQLELVAKANGTHRAEVAKLLVLTKARRQGVGRQLMEAIETQARHHQRTTLVLDTLQGAPSELLYQGLGYVKAGSIPEYVSCADGKLYATVVYYKLLT